MQAENGEFLADLVNQGMVIMYMDNGFDAGVIRGVEPMETTIPMLPELPFTRVLSKATKAEIAQLKKKSREEEDILSDCQAVLAKNRSLVRHAPKSKICPTNPRAIFCLPQSPCSQPACVSSRRSFKWITKSLFYLLKIRGDLAFPTWSKSFTIDAQTCLE